MHLIKQFRSFTACFEHQSEQPNLLHSRCHQPWISRNLLPKSCPGQPKFGAQSHVHYDASNHMCLAHLNLGRHVSWHIFHPLHRSTSSQQAKTVESCQLQQLITTSFIIHKVGWKWIIKKTQKQSDADKNVFFFLFLKYNSHVIFPTTSFCRELAFWL